MSYNLALFDNCTGLFYCLAKGANNLTGGAFWTLFLLSFTVILFMATYRYGLNRAFGFSSVFGLLISMILVTLKLISWFFASIFIVAGIIVLTAMIVSER